VSRSQVVVSAPAKINLCLGVGAVRPDGFHPLATVYQAVGLHDEVIARPGRGWSLTVAGHARIPVDEIPGDASNMAVRAALLLAEHHGVEPDVELVVHKGIPVAGGMAGGSADAAAALVACDTLWQTQTPRVELLGLAAELGSDVPFALVGGTALGSGRGELVAPAMTRGQYWWVVLESDVGLSTPAVYREFDVLHTDNDVPDPEVPDALMEALRTGDVEKLGAALSNDLQDPALRLRPELEDALALGLAASAYGALLSGSGPSCVFLCDGQEHAEQVAAVVQEAALGPVLYAPGPVPGARVVG
jgi:4-diphosphocytidyl-2-C-methyl-D-erythritol kinase